MNGHWRRPGPGVREGRSGRRGPDGSGVRTGGLRRRVDRPDAVAGRHGGGGGPSGRFGSGWRVPADRRTGLAHLPADGIGAGPWAGEPGAGPGGLPWPAGRPVRSAVAFACPPVRTAMVDRRVPRCGSAPVLNPGESGESGVSGVYLRQTPSRSRRQYPLIVLPPAQAF
jgi:hypothetical protein